VSEQVSRWSGSVFSALSSCTSTLWPASRFYVTVSTRNQTTVFTAPRWHNALSPSFATDSSEIMTMKVALR